MEEKYNNRLNAQYWQDRWETKQTAWDIGHASPPLVRYINQIEDKTTRVLIPGAGRAYEAIYMHQQGFTEVFICDWASSAFEHLRNVCPSFPEEHIIVGDFFDLSLKIDLILEQTFFCALAPILRQKYVQKTHRLLTPNGRLAGVFFGIDFPFKGPPFGGNIEEYSSYFSPYFNILQSSICSNSIAPRQGKELFIELSPVAYL